MSHGGSLRQYSGDPELASHLMHDYTQANLDPQTRAMLDYAVKLTRDPGSSQKADVEGLRSSGLSEEQILAVVLITCLYNFLTRLADGLGVEVPPGRQEATKKWLSRAAAQQEWLIIRKD